MAWQGKPPHPQNQKALSATEAMAIFHLRVKTLTRSKGHSAIAKAAYNSCACLSMASGEAVDYTKKSGLFLAEMMTPEGKKAPERGEFWRDVEAQEKRKDSQIAREIEISLPVELTQEQNKALAREITKTIIDKYSLPAADLCVHYPTKKKRKKNATSEEQPHIHLMIPTRDDRGKKIQAFRKEQYEETLFEIRKTWETICNDALKEARVDARITAATLNDQIKTLENQELEIKKQLDEVRHEISRREAKHSESQLENKPERHQKFKIETRSAHHLDSRSIQADHEGTGRPERPTVNGRGAYPAGTDRESGRDRPGFEQTGIGFLREKPGSNIATRITALRYQRQGTYGKILKIADRITALRYQRSQQFNINKNMENQDHDSNPITTTGPRM